MVPLLSPHQVSATAALSEESSEEEQWLPAAGFLGGWNLSPALKDGQVEGSGAKSLTFLPKPGCPQALVFVL